MSSNHRSIVVITVASALATGCAGLPTADVQRTASNSRDCARISADIAATQEAQRNAEERAHGAWKAVIPVAVVAKYATAKYSANGAGKELAELDAERVRRGCDSNAG